MKIVRDQHNHLLLGQNYDIDLLKIITEEIVHKFEGKLIRKLSEIDTAYFDISIGGLLITVHYEHYLGITIMPHRFFEKDRIQADSTIDQENALIDKVEKHFSEKFLHIKTS